MKPSKVPVLHAVTDKNKKTKLYPIHEVNWWNLGFGNSARATYCFSKFYRILKFMQKVKGFDAVRNNFPYFWNEVQKGISSSVNWFYKPWVKASSVPHIIVRSCVSWKYIFRYILGEATECLALWSFIMNWYAVIHI